MKVLKNVFIVLGLVALIVAISLLVKNAWDLRPVYQIAIANRSTEALPDPTPFVLLGAGVSLLAGLLLGLGIGLPRRTDGSVRAEAIDSYKRTTGPADVAVETRVTETERRTDLA